jgi:hypothetical protein
MSILSIDLHNSHSTIRLSFHFQNVTYESLDDIYNSVPGVTPCAWMTASTLSLIPPVRRLMPCCDSCCHSRCNSDSNWQEVTEWVYDDLTCPKYVLWDSNPGSWLAKEHKSRLRFGGRRLLRGCRNTRQLVARRLWCTDHQLVCLVWWLFPACSHERYTPNHYWASTVRGSWLDVPWGIFVSPNHHPASVTWSSNRLSSDQWILRHVLKFQPRCPKHHAKRDCRYRSANNGRLMTLLDLSPADFRRFLTVLVDWRLLGSRYCLSTGLVTNGISLTKRCNALSSRSDITRGLPDLGKSFTLLVCVCFLTSRLTTA